jgi:hypothetical protein
VTGFIGRREFVTLLGTTVWLGISDLNCRIRARATLKPQKYVAALPPATHAATTFQPSTPPLCSYYDERFAVLNVHARYEMLVDQI